MNYFSGDDFLCGPCREYLGKYRDMSHCFFSAESSPIAEKAVHNILVFALSALNALFQVVEMENLGLEPPLEEPIMKPSN